VSKVRLLSGVFFYSLMMNDIDFMMEALKEAEKAFAKSEVPVGAVVVKDGEIIARGHNLRETQQDPTAHAEMIAIKESALRLGRWRLTDCTIYVTLEPCAMCAGAMVLARIQRLVYGASDPKAGAVGSLMNILTDKRLNHQVEVESGILAKECGDLLRSLFSTRRK
jgi:tRNA(adenine34) deaminase